MIFTSLSARTRSTSTHSPVNSAFHRYHAHADIMHRLQFLSTWQSTGMHIRTSNDRRNTVPWVLTTPSIKYASCHAS